MPAAITIPALNLPVTLLPPRTQVFDHIHCPLLRSFLIRIDIGLHLQIVEQIKVRV